MVLLSGEPGIGKSRLVRGLRERLAGESHTSLRQFCSPYHTNSSTQSSACWSVGPSCGQEILRTVSWTSLRPCLPLPWRMSKKAPRYSRTCSE